MLDKLAAVEARYSQIEARLAAPETYDDPAQVARLNKEQNELSPVVETYRAYLRAREREQEAGALLSDPELRELAQEEQQQARQELERLEREYHKKRIYLSVVEANRPAAALYESFGYRFTGERDTHGERVLCLRTR